jgi:hypothetical protein
LPSTLTAASSNGAPAATAPLTSDFNSSVRTGDLISVDDVVNLQLVDAVATRRI